VLAGQRPKRIPFIDRMNLWYGAKRYAGTLPERFAGMSLSQIHHAVGLGELRFAGPYAHRLKGVEMRRSFEGREPVLEKEPLLSFFPGGWAPDFVPRDIPGVTRVELSTPLGDLSMVWEVAEDMVPMGGIDPYLSAHLIKDIEDLPIAEWIVERLEFVPLFDEFLAEAATMGPNGFLAPWLNRIPFQQLLLEYFGEVPLFYALSDHRHAVERLLAKVDAVVVESLERLSDLKVPYVEFPDNVDTMMTNPGYFARYALPAYQRYARILHAQGKKVGSHMDGNLGTLLPLIRECGLDVIESVCPAPLTEVTFEQFWEAWRDGGPIIWGGIPSTLLESFTDEDTFEAFVHRLLETVGNRPIILGISDMLVGENLIERVEYISRALENHPMDRDAAAATGRESKPESIPDTLEPRERPKGPATSDDLLDHLYDLTLDGDSGPVREVVEDGLDRGVAPESMLFDALIPALEEVGRLFELGSYYVPDLLLSARVMSDAMETLRPIITRSGVKPLGRLVMGTVRGDVHDIGKNLCSTMLEGAGFEIIDLGVNVKEEAFIAAIRDHAPQAVGMSALLTTTAPMIKTTIAAIEDAGMRGEVKILVGGAAVTPAFADAIAADGYSSDASAAVRMAKQLLGIRV
jgi:5-methyltetrahydrofolate--homocysteine methyltransferase